MSQEPESPGGADSPADALAPLSLFRALTGEQRAAILQLMKPRDVPAGQRLVSEGEDSDALFIVLHGAFEASRGDDPSPFAYIRAGEVIGEIGFFASAPRTATVTATRDATVLALDRAAYERIADDMPTAVTSLLAAIVRRLAETTARLPPQRQRAAARTVAVIHGGREPIPPAFFNRFRAAIKAAGGHLIDRAVIAAQFGSAQPDMREVTQWLGLLEWEEPLLVYLADEALTEWTRTSVRQADVVLMVTRGDAPAELTPVETFVADVQRSSARRLVRVHDRRVSVVSGTAAWLRRLPCEIQHHVSLEDDVDFRGLTRFLTGRAIGFVGGGGGAFGPSHIGIYKAFTERGVTFDAFIGTSVGAAILAGFAMLLSPEELDAGAHDIFVTSRGFKRPTFPKYALLDHKRFDAALARVYGAKTLVEDCWRPFFAVATNLSTHRIELIKSGLLWKAVRASSALPAVLPPIFTDDGMMLVDGGVMDNAPLAPLQEVKTGPNLVVHFGDTGCERFECRYEDIPGRGQLLASFLNPFGRKRRPAMPGAVNVLLRTLMVHQRYDLPVGAHDLVLRPPVFPGASFLDFDQHTAVFHASYEWARGRIHELEQAGDPGLRAILGLGGDRSAP